MKKIATKKFLLETSQQGPSKKYSLEINKKSQGVYPFHADDDLFHPENDYERIMGGGDIGDKYSVAQDDYDGLWKIWVEGDDEPVGVGDSSWEFNSPDQAADAIKTLINRPSHDHSLEDSHEDSPLESQYEERTDIGYS